LKIAIFFTPVLYNNPTGNGCEYYSTVFFLQTRQTLHSTNVRC